jgi:hypothetical protein
MSEEFQKMMYSGFKCRRASVMQEGLSDSLHYLIPAHHTCLGADVQQQVLEGLPWDQHTNAGTGIADNAKEKRKERKRAEKEIDRLGRVQAKSRHDKDNLPKPFVLPAAAKRTGSEGNRHAIHGLGLSLQRSPALLGYWGPTGGVTKGFDT